MFYIGVYVRTYMHATYDLGRVSRYHMSFLSPSRKRGQEMKKAWGGGCIDRGEGQRGGGGGR